MRFIITGRNIDVTEGLKSAVEEKLGKLDRFFAPETEVNVTLSVEKERQKIEVTIPVKGNMRPRYPELPPVLILATIVPCTCLSGR